MVNKQILKEQITNKLRELTGHNHVKLATRGNTAIRAVVAMANSSDKGTILIPEEGGWLEYQRIKGHEIVKCDDAKINLDDLKQKLSTKKIKALLYQNPGGYFAEQPMEEIYNICRENGCLVILDVSGSIGTELCNGKFADICVGSFGNWKLVEAHVGGFVSCRDEELFEKLEDNVPPDPHPRHPPLDLNQLETISEKFNDLLDRIAFLQSKIKKIKEDLANFDIVHVNDLSFVVVIKFEKDSEKQEIVDYCEQNDLPFTECPRYIRLNKPAISIEVKKMQF